MYRSALERRLCTDHFQRIRRKRSEFFWTQRNLIPPGTAIVIVPAGIQKANVAIAGSFVLPTTTMFLDRSSWKRNREHDQTQVGGRIRRDPSIGGVYSLVWSSFPVSCFRGAALTDFLSVVGHDTTLHQAINPSMGPKEHDMKIEELLAKLVEHYGQSLLKGGLDPERLPAVLSQAKYALASQLANDLAMAV